HVKEVHGKHLVFKVVAEDVGIVAIDGMHALFLPQQLDRRDEVAVLGRQLVLLASGGGGHALVQRASQIGAAAFQKQFHIVHRLGITIGRGESCDAGTETASDVVLQARPRMVAVQVDLARGNQEIAVNEIDDAIRQAGGEVGAEVKRTIFAQAA